MVTERSHAGAVRKLPVDDLFPAFGKKLVGTFFGIINEFRFFQPILFVVARNRRTGTLAAKPGTAPRIENDFQAPAALLPVIMPVIELETVNGGQRVGSI